jgi:DNA-binding transcriptional regulator GbsR (MarR family)
MDVDAIRCQFVQDNLRRAFMERDAERRRDFLRAFQAYFEWFSSRIPERQKLGIRDQLDRLEDLEASKFP